ncbi:sigma-70 family RNA polymerase sigma factor [Salinibacterium sp. G-O1]|uniref:sigma-70 family RNA polymerase sigma factor n=1 Tax=Salinibacterium sp. G-O1 TaxID=3046208 RepID=UPI0024BA05FB|nr:sigma-70 family RNA polymerase sigma factor [Salinibacterium sp. G-O1]MDJ0336469.1 sigma-70 family RNA polymerase sigma factor [Salinibacterium sp. G-O1]
MNSIDDTGQTTSDQTLIEQTRAGDQRAFAELWRRHYRSGSRVARQFTSSIDSDDLVSEAFTRIYQRVLAGGGPTGAFRPYLYTTIRNLASTWGAASRHVQVDEIADFEDPTTLDDPAAIALDRTLTARAFRSLPERWQSVLWYTEVEGMDPHEVAPVLGMTANGVAALSYRAREGLRKAWLQAHINDATASGECQWTISRIGEHARKGLSARDTERMDFHLATCAKCVIISEEVDEVGSRLAFVMLPILLGGVAGGAILASYGTAGSSMVASAGTIPALPAAFGPGAALTSGASTAAALGFFGVAGAPIAVVATLALVVAVSGSAVVLDPAQTELADDSTSSVTQVDASSAIASGRVPGVNHNLTNRSDDPTNIDAATQDGIANDDTGGGVLKGVDGIVGGVGQGLKGNLGGAVESVVDGVGSVVGGVGGVVGGVGGAVGGAVGGVVGGVGGAVGGVVGSVTESVTGGGPLADISLSLSGSATPGARLSLQSGGHVYATTTVSANGSWSINATGIPGGVGSLDLVQEVDRAYLKSLLPGGGALATVLGTVDALINALVRPLQLSSGSSGITINLVS